MAAPDYASENQKPLASQGAPTDDPNMMGDFQDAQHPEADALDDPLKPENGFPNFFCGRRIFRVRRT